MKSNVKKNYLYNLAYQILVMAVPLITTPYISRVLGAENIGIYSYTLSISAYFILFGSIGTGLYAQRQIAYFQNDKTEYSKIFWEILLIRVVGIGISIGIFSLLFVLSNIQYSKYYAVLILELIGVILDISWFYQGLEQFKITVIRNSIVKLTSIVLIFVIIKNESDLPLYFLIYVLSILGGNISIWFSLKKDIKLTSIKNLNPTKHLIPALLLFVPQVAIQIYTILDRTMLGYLIMDKTEVGYYDQGQKLIKTLIAIVTALGTVMLPRIANKYSEGDKTGIYESIYKSFQMVCIISVPMTFGIFSISKSFVPFFFGIGYEPVINLLRIICPVIFFIGFSNVIGVQLLLPTKREKQYTISVIVGASVNFLVNCLLIPKYGAIGASIGTVLAEGAVALIQLLFVKNEISIKRIFRDIWQYIICGIVMMCVCLCVELWFSGLKCLIFQLIAGVTSYGVMLFITKDRIVVTITNRIVKH